MTRRTFERIRAVRPSRLHLISDGPRATKVGEAERCRECREVVSGMIDWPCKVTRDFADANLGCGRRLSTGLTRAFAELGEAIVLEDDILPHPDFFPFCAGMLAKHRDNPQIHAINGFNPLGRYAPSWGAAIPSIFNCIWGWASWQRSWQDYRFDLSDWNSDEIKQRVRQHVASDLIYQFYAHSFDKMVRENVDTWDFQWSFTMLKHRRRAVVSASNFIENLGFTSEATHTTNAEPYFQNLSVYPTIATKHERSMSSADRLHDKLYAEVIMSPSQRTIALYRFLAKHPLALGLARRKWRL